MKQISLLILCVFIFFSLKSFAQQAGRLDKSFAQKGIGTYGISKLGMYSTANSTCIQQDGKIILAGETSYSGGTNIAVVRINKDGTRDSSFNDNGIFIIPKSTIDKYESANAVAVQPDGKIVLAGSMYDADWDDSGELLIVRLNSNGSLDKSFNGSGKKYMSFAISLQATSLVIQPDGKIVLAGHTNRYVNGGGEKNFYVARLNSDGLLDKGFGKNGQLQIDIGRREDVANSVALQPDGKILLAGYSYDLNNRRRMAVVRLHNNGVLDSGFNKNGKFTTHFGGGYDEATTVLVQADNKIVLTGHSYNSEKTTDDFSLLRLTIKGSLDSSFNEDGKLTIAAAAGDNYANSAALQPDGKILVAGNNYPDDYKSNYAVVRVNSNGYTDSGFNNDGRLSIPIAGISDIGQAVTVQSNGKIIVAGSSKNNRDWFDFSIINLNSNGSLNKSFNGNGKLILPIGNSDDFATAMAITSTDKIIVAGYSDMIGQALNFSLLRLNKNGSLDKTFDEDGKLLWPDNDSITTQAYAIAVQPDGKTLVAGVNYESGNSHFLILRLNNDGKLDSSFNNTGKLNVPIGNFHDEARAIAIQPNGKIVVAGYSYNGSDYDFSAIRINANGALDNSFDSDGKLSLAIPNSNEYLDAVSIQADGKILLAGAGIADGKRSFFIVRLNSNGKPDNSFDNDGKLNILINASSRVHTLAIQEDGKIIAAGESYDSYPNYNMAVIRLNNDGSFDNSFGENGKFIMPSDKYYGFARAMVIQPDGRIVLLSNSSLLVRLNSSGSLDSSFGTNGKTRPSKLVFNGNFTGIGLQQDGNIIAAGNDRTNESPADFVVMRFLGDISNGLYKYAVSEVSANERIHSNHSIKYWPNPVKNIVHIQLNEVKGDKTIIQLQDLKGNVLTQQKIKSANTQLDLSAFSNGVYLLVIIDEKGKMQSKKILLRR